MITRVNFVKTKLCYKVINAIFGALKPKSLKILKIIFDKNGLDFLFTPVFI